MSHLEDNITKIKICYSLWQSGVSPEEIPAELGVHRATVYRWIKGFRLGGKVSFIRKYKLAKRGRKQPRKTHGFIKARVCRIRQEYKNCCGEKIVYIMRRDYGQDVSVSTVYRILNERFILRSKWKKYSKRGYVRKGSQPRDVLQVDTVDFGGVYAFTAIDTYTREAHVVLRPALTSQDGKTALRQLLHDFGNINHIQRDGGSEFKAQWQELAHKHIHSIRTARPYKKNEQAFIERFNGILRKECLGYHTYNIDNLSKIQQKVNQFLDYYHNKRPHLSLNMLTPSEFAAAHAAS